MRRASSLISFCCLTAVCSFIGKLEDLNFENEVSKAFWSIYQYLFINKDKKQPKWKFKISLFTDAFRKKEKIQGKK